MCGRGVWDLKDSSSVGCIRLLPAEVLLPLLASLALSCDSTAAYLWCVLATKVCTHHLCYLQYGGESANGTAYCLYSMHTWAPGNTACMLLHSSFFLFFSTNWPSFPGKSKKCQILLTAPSSNWLSLIAMFTCTMFLHSLASPTDSSLHYIGRSHDLPQTSAGNAQWIDRKKMAECTIPVWWLS